VNLSLAGAVNGAPERFVPEEMRGDLIEAEHIGRYRWATRLVPGCRVLDAGCGTAYGTTILAEAGALAVEGVDIAEDVVRAVEPRMPEGVNLTVADVQELPFEDGAFDVVVCFEVLEHLDEAERAVNEFARVLARDGFAVVSSPNRTVYPAGNPHHKHEFLPEELRLLLDRQFEFVDLYRQQSWLASAVLKDNDYASEATDLAEARLHKVVRAELGTELYTVAVAGSARPPLAPAAAVLTSRPGMPLTMEDALEKRVAADGGGPNEQIAGGEPGVTGLRDRISELETELSDANNREKKLERHASELRERAGELEARLRDANDQMLRRDEELQRAYAAEASHAAELHEEIARLDNLVQSRDAEIRELANVLEGMHATRIWRLGSAYWGVRDRLRLGRLRGRR
jgi:ubiquinone/menaquinone biosynthesis C-methylase UbiE